MLNLENLGDSMRNSMDSGRLILVSGPCSMEDSNLTQDICAELVQISKELDIDLIFKSSFDKANRTNVKSYRSMGIEQGLQILNDLREHFAVPVTTDVHETWQVPLAAEVVDIIQIPAFLCRQTDLIVAAGGSGKVVNIKKGQFMSPEEMRFVIEKAGVDKGNLRIVTERGSSFGYNNLIVDFRSLPIMRKFAPTFFDVTHSTQRPGSLNGSSGGNREWAPYLARAAAAVGVDGYFIETHPNPDKALSDGPLMIKTNKMRALMEQLKQIHDQQRSFIEI
jgi:2-dehydro-3-deoxyphosphooctonate aldolase (KDO 8-P synthase)